MKFNASMKISVLCFAVGIIGVACFIFVRDSFLIMIPPAMAMGVFYFAISRIPEPYPTHKIYKGIQSEECNNF